MSRRHRAFIGAATALAIGAGGAGAPSRPAEQAIPPDAEHAMEALTASPRHGEWVDVPLLGAGGENDAQPPVKTWVVYPERSDKAPVVIVIHEIMGMTDWVRAVADRLAAEGFIAVAPDLLSGRGPGGGGTESFPGDQVRSEIRKLRPEDVAKALDSVRQYAIGRPAATSKTATIGFCWGGSTSFAYATAQPALDAAVVYYGTAPESRDALERIACPVLGLYGGDDARVTSTVEGTAAAMKDLGKTFRFHVYEGAGHGFLRNQAGRDGANLEASRTAWAATVRFLGQSLGG